MPTIPRIDSSVQLQTTQARQSIQTSAANFGGLEAAALQGVSSGLSDLADRQEEMRQEDDATESANAFTSASDALRERSRGEEGYLNLRGEAAYTGYDQFSQDVEDIPSQFTEGLSEDALAMFNNAWRGRRESALNQGSTHASGQRKVWQSSTDVGIQTESSMSAVDDRGGGPAAVSVHLAEGSGAIIRRMTREGAAPEAIEVAVAQWRSTTALTTISAAVDGNDVENARALLAGLEGDLVGGDKETAIELLANADGRITAQNATDDLMATHGNDFTAMRRDARANFEGETRDSIINRINARENEEGISASDASLSLLTQAEDLIEGGMKVDDLTSSMQLALGSTTMNFLRDKQDGVPSVTNDAAYQRYHAMTRAELRAADMPQMRRDLADREYEEILNLRSGAMRPFELTSIQSTNAQITTSMDEMNLKDNARDAFRNRVTDAITAQAVRLDRNLDTVETQEIINTLSREVVINDGGIPFLGNQKGPLFDVEIEGVPPEDMAAVVAAFPNGTITEETAGRFYQEAISILTADGANITPERITEMIGDVRAEAQRRLDEQRRGN